MITQDFEEYQTKKSHVRYIWLIMQAVILLNYLLELSEGYMKGWLIKPLPWDVNI